ncbi:MAG: DUF6843 domain-containing protein [Aridibacter sp.]|nr:hypothetical protein [Acidobacteriota bacterium]
MKEKVFQTRSKTFKVGIIFTVFWSFIVGFFNIAILYWFGIPIIGLLIGIILVWISRESVKSKLVLTVLPVPIILISFILFYIFLPKAQPETFLIPQNYRGEIQIIFDEQCGQELKYIDGRRIYEFSNDGLIITKASQTFGVVDREFYLINEYGNRTELPELHWSNFDKEKEDWHWIFSSNELSKDMVGVFWAYHNSFSFMISDYYSIKENFKEEKEKQFHKVADSLLNQCRQSK